MKCSKSSIAPILMGLLHFIWHQVKGMLLWSKSSSNSEHRWTPGQTTSVHPFISHAWEETSAWFRLWYSMALTSMLKILTVIRLVIFVQNMAIDSVWSSYWHVIHIYLQTTMKISRLSMLQSAARYWTNFKNLSQNPKI